LSASDRWCGEERLCPLTTFDGIRLSKGATREEGWIALLGMLDRAEDDEPGVDGQSQRRR